MCNDTYNDFIYLLLLTIIVGNVIVAVNYILKIVLRALGNFQKYPTITAQTMGTTMNLFFAMFINTAIITLLLQANIYGFKPAIVVSAPIPPLMDS